MQAFIQMLSHEFMGRAVVVGLLISLCASLLGVVLVLKRYAMIGDGLSHVSVGALCVAAVLGLPPLAVSVPVAILAAFLLLRISENSSLRGDAAIAVISTTSLAVGVFAVSITTGLGTDINNYLFGSILTIKSGDMYLSVILCAVVFLVLVLFYNRIFAVTFDEDFARGTGLRASRYNALIAILTAVTVVLGMRMMGALLISGLIIFPALTAMRVCKRFKAVVIAAAAISVVCFLLGTVISFVGETPTGASVVAVNICALAIFSLAGFAGDRRTKA